MIIRWCLHLRMLSGSAYDALRHVLVLPSDRTLRDYTHYNDYIKAGVHYKNSRFPIAVYLTDFPYFQ